MSHNALAEQLALATWSGDYNGSHYLPIPHPRDEPVEALLRAYRADPQSDGAWVYADSEVQWVLLSYAERMAALAVRLRSQPVLELAVLALGLVRPWDGREKLIVLPTPWRSAEILGVDARSLFERIAAEVPEPGRSDLIEFARRAPHAQSLSCMGYREGTDQDGFIYVRT